MAVKLNTQEIKNKILKTVLVNWKNIKPFQPDDLKKITDEQLEKLKKSIVSDGFIAPLFVWQNGKTIYSLDGHLRVRALNSLESDGVKVPEKLYSSFIDCKNKKEAKRFISKYNSQYGKIDSGIYLDWMEDIDIDEIQTEIEIPEIDFDFEPASEIVEDEPPSIPEKPKSKLCDIYELGPHKILCGDSTDEKKVEKLMNGKTADIIFTDPPYGVAIGDKNKLLDKFQKCGRNKNNIKNDTLGEEELYKLLKTSFSNVKNNLSEVSSIFVTAPQGGSLGLMMMMMMMMKDAGLPIKHIIIWKKNSQNFSLGRLDYEYKHEPILYTWDKKHKFYAKGEQRSSVWEFDKPRSSKLHPTMKPIPLIVNALKNNSLKNQICLDIFLGSGSTLIACEQTNRICYGMELEPAYVDVIVQRWVNFTGQEKIKKNGKIITWKKTDK